MHATDHAVHGNRATRRPASAGVRAFTLIELLIVVAILAVVVSVLAAALGAGISVLQTAQTVNVEVSAAALGTETIERDLRNTFPFYAISFVGGRRDVSFPGIVEQQGGEGFVSSIGTVAYEFDSENGVLRRRKYAFPGSGGEDDTAEPLVSGLYDIAWTYMDITGENAGVWKRSWDDPTNFPDLVRIELVFDATDGNARFERTVVLPTPGVSGERKDEEAGGK